MILRKPQLRLKYGHRRRQRGSFVFQAVQSSVPTTPSHARIDGNGDFRVDINGAYRVFNP